MKFLSKILHIFKDKKTRLAAISIILAVVLCVLGVFIWDAYTKPEVVFAQKNVRDSAITGESKDNSNNAENSENFDGVCNILLVGTDYADERANWAKDVCADTIIVLAVDFDKRKVDMISIPRDSYAKIYNTPGNWRLNSAFSLGGGYDKNGPEYVMESVQYILGGIPVDYYIGVDIPAFKDIIDAIGGMDLNIDVNINIQGRSLNTGYQHLNGQQVMDYCRARKGIDDDLGRVDRQKRVLLELFKQIKSSGNLDKLFDIIQSLLGKVHTNLTLEQIYALIKFGNDISDQNITMHTLAGNMIPIFNWKYFIINQQERVNLISDIYGINVEEDTQYSFINAQYTWAVLQATQYVELVKRNLIDEKDSKKLMQQDVVILNTCIKNVQEAIASRNIEKIDNTKDILKQNSDKVIQNYGLPVINWYVNENEGYG